MTPFPNSSRRPIGLRQFHIGMAALSLCAWVPTAQAAVVFDNGDPASFNAHDGYAVPFATGAATESSLKNGEFNQPLEPWKCSEGKIVPDPDKEENTVLEVTLEDGVFGLSQDFKWPDGHDSLTLSFRVKASAASKKSTVQWRLRLYDENENSALAAGGVLKESDEWIVVKETIQRPKGGVVSIMLETNRGNGKLWIDDFKIE